MTLNINYSIGKLKEGNEEKEERLKYQMDYINRQIRIQMDKTKEEKKLWVQLNRELKKYPNVKDVKDPDDEVFMKAWFIASEIIPNTTPSVNEDNNQNDNDGDDDKVTEPFHSDHDDSDDDDDENSQYSTEKQLRNDEEKFIMNMHKCVNHLRNELRYEECVYEVVKNINEDCKRKVIAVSYTHLTLPTKA